MLGKIFNAASMLGHGIQKTNTSDFLTLAGAVAAIGVMTASPVMAIGGALGFACGANFAFKAALKP